jgi:plasmid stabilization system protein ParE
MKPVRLTRQAGEDLATAVEFYDLQEPGAGDLLFDAVFRQLRRLERLHGFHGQRHGFHKVLVKDFPHAIYYDILDRNEVIVVAILDGRRAPSSIREEIRTRKRDQA